MIKISLLVFTDGRASCLMRTLKSFTENVHGVNHDLILMNDCADPAYAQWLEDTHGDTFTKVMHTHPDKKGFCGIIQEAWKNLSPDTDYIFHLEDDFEFNRSVDLTELAAVLDANSYIAQMALRRQPVNELEAAAGGLVEMWPNEYEDKEWAGRQWLEHRLFFTTNPTLYSQRLTIWGWPNGPRCEQTFGDVIKANSPEARFAFWGARESGEWVHHIGDVRVGNNY